MKVYLAGPITRLDYKGAVEWRDYAIQKLFPIRGMSPMRGKEYLSNVKEFTCDGDKYRALSVLSSDRGIMTRDRNDATTCDVLLVNFLGATRVSIGTVMEIAWADGRRIPIVCAMEKTGNVHDHGMVKEAIGFRVETLDEAIQITRSILLGSGAGLAPSRNLLAADCVGSAPGF